MSKKQLQDLSEKYDKVVSENETLKSRLAELNENTVISSMNDMKDEYDKLMRSSVSIDKFMHVKCNYKQCQDVTKTVNGVNNVNIDQINSLISF